MKFNRTVIHDGVTYVTGAECPKTIENEMKRKGFVGGEGSKKPKAESGMRVASVDHENTTADDESDSADQGDILA